MMARFQDGCAIILTGAALIALAACGVGGGGGDGGGGGGGGTSASLSLSLSGRHTDTQVVGTRFGSADTGDPEDDGVVITLSSNQGTIEYDVGCTGTFVTYDSGNKPRFAPNGDSGAGLSNQGTTIPGTSSEYLDFCYRAGSLNRSARLVYDVTPPASPALTDHNGNDPTAPVVYTQYPTFTPSVGDPSGDNTGDPSPGGSEFDNETGYIYYTTNSADPIADETISNRVAYDSSGAGQGEFPFSSALRQVKLLAVDDVGNEAAITTVPISMDLVGTDPSAGYYMNPQLMEVVPEDDDFLDPTLSAAYLLLCRYTDGGGYGCENDDLNPDGAYNFDDFGTETDASTTDYAYDFEVAPNQREEIELRGTSGITTVFDLKILYDPLSGDGLTDSVTQALFVLDRDLPDVVAYPDPDAVTDDTVNVGATAYDAGYYTLDEAQITNYALQRSPLNQCNTDGVCYRAVRPSLTLPGAAAKRPDDNSPQTLQVTAVDAAGNLRDVEYQVTVGRSHVGGSSTAANANLGQAIAAADFDGDNAFDYAVSEPANGNGVVYVFQSASGRPADEVIRTNFTDDFESNTFTTIDASANTTLTITVTRDGAAVGGGAIGVDLSARSFTGGLGSLSPSALAHGFNRAVMDYAANNAPNDLAVYMAPVDTDGDGTRDAVRLLSDADTLDTCITVAAGGLNALLGLPTTQQCIYDSAITGGAANDLFGHALTVGDFDNDSVQDLAVGAPGADEVYIFDGGTVAGATTNADADVTLTGAAGEEFGWALDAGNLDETDAGDDLVVGAPGLDDGGDTEAGAVYAWYSPIAGGAADDSQINPRTVGEAERTGERFGHAVAVILLRGTGSTEQVAVGAPGVTELYGSGDGEPTVASNNNPGNVYIRDTDLSQFQPPAEGRSANAKFGWSLVDVRGMFGGVMGCESDQPRCLAIGAPHGENPNLAGSDHGAVYIGDASAQAIGSPGRLVVAYGQQNGAGLGSGLESGDVDGDGRTDLLMGQLGGPHPSIDGLGMNYGGLALLLGAEDQPEEVAFARAFTAPDADASTGDRLQTRFGGAIRALDTSNDLVIDRLIVGAPGGKLRTLNSGSQAGRLHILEYVTFEPLQ